MMGSSSLPNKVVMMDPAEPMRTNSSMVLHGEGDDDDDDDRPFEFGSVVDADNWLSVKSNEPMPIIGPLVSRVRNVMVTPFSVGCGGHRGSAVEVIEDDEVE